MKIIRPGQLPEEVVFKGTCSNCKTVFECKRSEGEYHSAQRDGDWLSVKCPLCGKQANAYKKNDGALIPPAGSPRWDDTGGYMPRADRTFPPYFGPG